MHSFNSYQNPVDISTTPFVRSGGFLTRMFGRQGAAFLIESLLKVNANDVYLIGNVPGWHNALMVQHPSIGGTRSDAVANDLPLWLLDFLSPMSMYHVLPQKIWTPPNQSDWRRYIEPAHLRMPVFFVRRSGALGLPLPRAVVGDTASLRGADNPAPLGGGNSTQIRIAWPGYQPWERQIQIRDETRRRNEIRLERFAKLVAGVVDRFITHAFTTGTRETNWRIGPGGITRDHVIIVGTVQVSAGGWMPVLTLDQENL